MLAEGLLVVGLSATCGFPESVASVIGLAQLAIAERPSSPAILMPGSAAQTCRDDLLDNAESCLHILDAKQENVLRRLEIAAANNPDWIHVAALNFDGSTDQYGYTRVSGQGYIPNYGPIEFHNKSFKCDRK